MECSCDASVEIEGYDTVSLHSEHKRKAIKNHKCHECRRVISKGEIYNVEKYLFEGGWSCHKTCIDCLSVRKAFFPSGFYYERLWEDLAEFIHESQGDIPEDCISELPDIARGKVCDLIEDAYSYWYKGE